MPTFNGQTLTVTLDSGVTEIDVIDDIYEPWKDWMVAEHGNRRFPPAFRSDGGNPLSSIINQGSYIFLNNLAGWRIKPPEEDITIYLTGNLAVEDTSYPAFIATTGAYTAAILGLQPVTQGVTEYMGAEIEYGSFDGAVWIDTTSSNSGTGRTADGRLVGSPRAPVNNITDAHVIAEERGFPTFEVLADLHLTVSAPSLKDHVFIGASKNRVTIDIDADADVENCAYHSATITGTLDGDSVLKDCIVKDLVYIKGYIELCVLGAGTIELGGSETAHFLDCWAGAVGDDPIIDCGGSGQSLALRNFNGSVVLTNKIGADDVEANLNSAVVILDHTVAAGNIYCVGDGKVLGKVLYEQTVNGLILNCTGWDTYADTACFLAYPLEDTVYVLKDTAAVNGGIGQDLELEPATLFIRNIFVSNPGVDLLVTRIETLFYDMQVHYQTTEDVIPAGSGLWVDEFYTDARLVVGFGNNVTIKIETDGAPIDDRQAWVFRYLLDKPVLELLPPGESTFNNASLVNETSIPETIVDAIFEEPVADHEAAGTYGELIGKKLLTFAKFIGLK